MPPQSGLDFSRIRFGATAWSWYDPSSKDIEDFINAATEIKGLNFPDQPGAERYIEILSILPSLGDKEENSLLAREMKKIAGDNNMRIIDTGFIPDMPGAANLYSLEKEERKVAVDLIKKGIDHASNFVRDGYAVLAGPIQVVHESFPKNVLSEIEMNNMENYFVDTVSEEIVPYAAERKVKVGFEPLNHDESLLVLRPGKTALDLIKRIGSPFIGLNVDTIHYAQEAEGCYIDAVADVVQSGKAFNLHLCEHNRKEFGTGDIGYRVRRLMNKVTTALPAKNVLYVGLENFFPGLHRPLRIWRPNTDPKQVVRNAAEYLKKELSN